MICLSFLKICLSFFFGLSFLGLEFFRNVKKKPALGHRHVVGSRTQGIIFFSKKAIIRESVSMPGAKTRFNLMPITDLTPGNEYKFRVFAENVYGRSDPSDESPSCQTKGMLKKKQPKTKYEIDPETGKKIRGQKCEVKDYDQFVFDIYAKYIPQV